LLFSYLGTHEEAGHQLLPHPDSKMHSSEYSIIRDLQPSQEVQERAQKDVQEDTITEHDSSNGNASDHQNGCTGPVIHVGDPAIDGREVPNICDTESYVVATGTWENLRNEICRLCASTDGQPRQSIVDWLDMLNEIIPGLVSYLFLFTDLFAIL